MNYIIYNKIYGYEIFENTTLEEVKKYIEEKRNDYLNYYKEQLKKEEQDLEYFYNKEYDKMSIIDRNYFLNNGKEGLQRLEEVTKRNIDDFKENIKCFSSTESFRIFKEMN